MQHIHLESDNQEKSTNLDYDMKTSTLERDTAYSTASQLKRSHL